MKEILKEINIFSDFYIILFLIKNAFISKIIYWKYQYLLYIITYFTILNTFKIYLMFYIYIYIYIYILIIIFH